MGQIQTTGYPFIMFYNARGDSLKPKEVLSGLDGVSENMTNWRRLGLICY